MKRDLYAEATGRIIERLEVGTAPWVKPWSATPGANTPCNAVSNRAATSFCCARHRKPAIARRAF
jgi:antirestriction protein ArdC